MRWFQHIALAFLISLVLLTTGCIIEVSSPQQSEPSTTVIFMETELRQYIERARGNEADLDSLYSEIVLKPVQQRLDSSNSSLKVQDYQRPIYDLVELELALDLLESADVVSLVQAALAKSYDYIQGVDTTVFIFPCDPGDYFTRDEMRGVRGVSGLTCGNTILSVNPWAEGWEETLPYVVAHEYHHVTWGLRHGHKFAGDMLEILILEGRADSFADIVYPGRNVPWTSSLSIEEEREFWWTVVKDDLYSTDLAYAKRITQENNWAGYAIGYHIVQEYIRTHPEVGIEEWTGLTARELFQDSGYEDWLGN